MTFTGQQSRLTHPDAPANQLTETRQRYWRYPQKAEEAADYFIDEAQGMRDCYFAVHLFGEPGNRRAANALPTVRCLWLDEDGGEYPEEGPEPTAIVRSSAERRHLYWRLTQPVSVEWAVAMNRRLAAWASGDIGKAALASVLRAAGTANFKRHPQVDLVIGEITGSGPWEPAVIDQAVPEFPRPSNPTRSENYDGPEVELEPYLAREAVEVLGKVADGLGTKYAIVCPWIFEHTGGDRSGTYVGHRADGGLWFTCHHEHCQGRTWREFKRAVLWNRRFTIGEEKPDYSGPGITVEVRYE